MRPATHLRASNPPAYMCHDVNNQIRIQKVCDSASVTHRGWECEMNAALYKHCHINVNSLGHTGWDHDVSTMKMHGNASKTVTRQKKSKKNKQLPNDLKAQRANTGTAKHKQERRAVSNPSGRKAGKNRSKVKGNEQNRGKASNRNTFHIKHSGVC